MVTMKRLASASTPSLRGLVPRRGRPRKFRAPSRAVTLTLPEDVLAALGAIDRDLGRAIVRAAQPEMAKRTHPPAELATFGRRAVIVVNPTRTLEEHTGILLIPLPDGRALISFDKSMTIDSLELRIEDVLEEQRLPKEDLRIFEAIRDLLRSGRRAGDVQLHERQIIVLESDGGNGATVPASRDRRPEAAAALLSSPTTPPADAATRRRNGAAPGRRSARRDALLGR